MRESLQNLTAIADSKLTPMVYTGNIKRRAQPMMDLNEAQRNVENSRIVKEIDKFRIMLKHFKEYIDKKDQDLIVMRNEVEENENAERK